MSPKRRPKIRKIQRSGGTHFIIISKEAMEKLNLKAQDPNCLLVEIPDPARHRLVYKVLRLDFV